MAFSQFDFFSASLKKVVSFNILLPNDCFPDMIKGNINYNRPTKILMLLIIRIGCLEVEFSNFQ